jgi:hypothetical protein
MGRAGSSAPRSFSSWSGGGPIVDAMSRQRNWSTERRSWGERAWRKMWSKTARRYRDREAEEGITAADLAIQDPPRRDIPAEAVPSEVLAWLDGGGLRRWAGRAARERALSEARRTEPLAEQLKRKEDRVLTGAGRY